MTQNSAPLLEVREVKKDFPVRAGLFGASKLKVHAVDGVSFSVERGETLGLVGESGCGKTTLVRTIAGQYRPTAGSILFEGANVATLDRKDALRYKRNVQMVCQDPYSSLDPRMTVEDIVAEPLDIHTPGLLTDARRQKVDSVLEMVGLRPSDGKRYPHEFSGGQRQRIGIARALVIEPSIVLCDEPVSALDVSIQSQVLNLFSDLQKVFNAAFIFVAHSLHVIRHTSRRVIVMYLGRLLETGDCGAVFDKPLHPYTVALMSCVPVPDPRMMRTRERVPLKGEVPSPVNPPEGCAFHSRCPVALERCARERPELLEAEQGHRVACWRSS